MIAASDEELVRLSVKGNREAFGTLYDRYFVRLCFFAGGYLRDQTAAEDAVQEVFYRMMRQLSTFDTQKKFSTWIYQVTKNHCLNVIRNESNRARLRKAMEQPSLFDVTGADQFENEEALIKKIGTAVAALSDRQKRIFRLRFQEEKAIREISEQTGSPEGTIKSAIFYILKKITTHLKKSVHE